MEKPKNETEPLLPENRPKWEEIIVSEKDIKDLAGLINEHKPNLDGIVCASHPEYIPNTRPDPRPIPIPNPAYLMIWVRKGDESDHTYKISRIPWKPKVPQEVKELIETGFGIPIGFSAVYPGVLYTIERV